MTQRYADAQRNESNPGPKGCETNAKRAKRIYRRGADQRNLGTELKDATIKQSIAI